MPLVTEDIGQARAAYAVLELRAQNAELKASTLRATVDNQTANQQFIKQRADMLTGYTVSQIQTNAQLTVDQAKCVSPDVTLDSFIAALGLAVALAEASMPDRVINSVTATVPTFLTLSTGPDGRTQIAGLRLYQPEFGAATVAATTSFQLAKVAVEPNVSVPRSLYAVLQDKQALFSDAFWQQFSSGSPPVAPAGQIVAEITKVLSQAGQWTFPFLVQEATVIGSWESTLSTLVGSVAAPEKASAYVSAVSALTSLCQSLNPASRTNFVAGDLFALVTAFDLTTRVATTLRS